MKILANIYLTLVFLTITAVFASMMMVVDDRDAMKGLVVLWIITAFTVHVFFSMHMLAVAMYYASNSSGWLFLAVITAGFKSIILWPAGHAMSKDIIAKREKKKLEESQELQDA